MNVAAQMMETGVPGEVQLTRNTYELIFASGFRVRERGDFPLRDAGTFMTYLVSPG
jgi:class 3 adenylate cyclase